MDHGVDPIQQLRIGGIGIPLPLVGPGRGPAHQAHHLMASGGQKRGQGGSDQARRARQGDPQGPLGVVAAPPVRVEVPRQLALPVGEHGAQQARRHRALDDVGDAGRALPEPVELMDVGPPQGHPPGLGDQLVGEAVRRVEAVGLVPCDPPGAARQPQHRVAVTQRRGFRQYPHRLPGRRQPGQGSGPAVPGEHLLHGGVHHPVVLEFHEPDGSEWRIRTAGSSHTPRRYIAL